jgi:hypothetical protein
LTYHFRFYTSCSTFSTRTSWPVGYSIDLPSFEKTYSLSTIITTLRACRPLVFELSRERKLQKNIHSRLALDFRNSLTHINFLTIVHKLSFLPHHIRRPAKRRHLGCILNQICRSILSVRSSLACLPLLVQQQHSFDYLARHQLSFNALILLSILVKSPVMSILLWEEMGLALR